MIVYRFDDICIAKLEEAAEHTEHTEEAAPTSERQPTDTSALNKVIGQLKAV